MAENINIYFDWSTNRNIFSRLVLGSPPCSCAMFNLSFGPSYYHRTSIAEACCGREEQSGRQKSVVVGRSSQAKEKGEVYRIGISCQKPHDESSLHKFAVPLIFLSSPCHLILCFQTIETYILVCLSDFNISYVVVFWRLESRCKLVC